MEMNLIETGLHREGAMHDSTQPPQIEIGIFCAPNFLVGHSDAVAAFAICTRRPGISRVVDIRFAPRAHQCSYGVLRNGQACLRSPYSCGLRCAVFDCKNYTGQHYRQSDDRCNEHPSIEIVLQKTPWPSRRPRDSWSRSIGQHQIECIGGSQPGVDRFGVCRSMNKGRNVMPGRNEDMNRAFGPLLLVHLLKPFS